MPVFIDNPEVSAIAVIQRPRELAFSLHTEICSAYFAAREVSQT